MRVLICLLCIAVMSIAQPQAPIEWGEMRILEDDPTYPGVNIRARGDTIVLIGIYDISGWSYPVPKVSGDNGQTWSDWTILGDTTRWSYQLSWLTFVMDSVILCYGLTDPSVAHWGGYRTYDLGQTWQWPCETNTTLNGHGTIGDTVLCTISSDQATWTSDGGCAYADTRPIPLLWGGSAGNMSASDQMIHVVGRRVDPSDNRAKFQYSRATWTGEFEPMQIINPDIFWVDRGYMAFDREGNGMILTLVEYTPPAPDLAAVVVNYTHDDGASWSQPDTLTPFESSASALAEVDQKEGIWMAAWNDIRIQDGFEYPGFWCALSMNRGRAWYPAHQITNENINSGGLADVDIQGDHIRVYAIVNQVSEIWGNYFLQWEGIVTIDSTAPSFLSAEELPLLVPIDTTLHLEATAFDNDSLWLMQFVAHNLSGDTVTIPLQRTDDNCYMTNWHVQDTTRWRYYYQAEDMWENKSYYPADGPNAPFELHVGVIHSLIEPPIQPKDYLLSVYPNPGNSEFTITGSYLPGIGPRSIVIYDVLGREVTRLAIPSGTVDRFQVFWNATTQANHPVGSGVYFVVPETDSNASTRRITLIR